MGENAVEGSIVPPVPDPAPSDSILSAGTSDYILVSTSDYLIYA